METVTQEVATQLVLVIAVLSRLFQNLSSPCTISLESFLTVYLYSAVHIFRRPFFEWVCLCHSAAEDTQHRI
jgi:hypothetical protein